MPGDSIFTGFGGSQSPVDSGSPVMLDPQTAGRVFEATRRVERMTPPPPQRRGGGASAPIMQILLCSADEPQATALSTSGGSGQCGGSSGCYSSSGAAFDDELYPATIQIYDSSCDQMIAYADAYLMEPNGNQLFAGEYYLARLSGKRCEDQKPIFITTVPTCNEGGSIDVVTNVCFEYDGSSGSSGGPSSGGLGGGGLGP